MNPDAADLSLPPSLQRWLDSRAWQLNEIQRAALEAWRSGAEGVIHAPTGSGKTFAALIGWLDQVHAENRGSAMVGSRSPRASVLWITPLRALAADTRRQLGELSTAVAADGLEVGLLTSDTRPADRARWRRRLPPFLVTTPESLSLLLSHPPVRRQLDQLELVVCDEWHELMANKRGVQLQLALAHLRRRTPSMRQLGLSATLGNLEEAVAVLSGPNRQGRLISRPAPRRIALQILLPSNLQRFPWGGHLGLTLLPQVIQAIESAQSTLLFTNTRSQAELWYEALLKGRLDWLTEIALHHGSLDRKIRRRIEEGLLGGHLRCVVCTSSLDLGVDFAPVDQVIQVGSPKGVARLLQRAGRSGHRPDGVSRLVCVPAHAFEIQEFAAARMAIEEGIVESRRPLRLALDVLVQHVVTLAISGECRPEDVLAEARSTHAFAALSAEDWQWVIDFVCRGGEALQHYPDYRKVVLDEEGFLQVSGPRIARRHRMQIGTIVADSQIRVAFRSGRSLGTVEETFVSRLRKGDCFLLGGRLLEFLRLKDMTAQVKPAHSARRIVPRWNGGRMPLSVCLADAVLRRLDYHASALELAPAPLAAQASRTADAPANPAAAANAGGPQVIVAGAGRGRLDALDDLPPCVEERLLSPLYRLQALWSRIPDRHTLLIEEIRTREGLHWYLYPFAGRLVHEGLAALLAWRISQRLPLTLHMMANDYGIEFFCSARTPIAEEIWRESFAEGALLEDVLASINSSELARRHFRELARVAGLIFTGYPGAPKTDRLLQMSSGILFDVLRQYDQGNRLLGQAEREVLTDQIEYVRLADCLHRIAAQQIVRVEAPRLTPFAFPLWAARVRSQTISSEKWDARLGRLLDELERAADRDLSSTTSDTDNAGSGAGRRHKGSQSGL